jgi:S1-C subfamily serine protease
MNALDAVLLVTVALAIVFGWRLGLVSTLTSVVAVAVGGAVGFLLGRQVAAAIELPREPRATLLMVTAVAGILLGQALVAQPVRNLHEKVVATPFRYLNGAGGAAITVGFTVALVWMMATAFTLVSSASVQLASLMRGSVVLTQLDRTLPTDAGIVFQQFEATAGLEEAGVFRGLGLLPVPRLPSPGGDASPAVERIAEESVVRVMGNTVCGTGVAGSGVVVEAGLVMTNAHVVAGVSRPYVSGERQLAGSPAVPVFFDPVRDIALLQVPGLDRPAVELAGDPAQGDVVAVAGFPNAGPQTVKPAAVRGSVKATSTDIYGSGRAQRSVLVLSGTVLPGDSGGPLLDGSGRMVGLTFAATQQAQSETGYALAMSDVREALQGAVSDGAVATGSCIPAD